MFPRSVEQAYQGRTLLPYLFDVVEHRWRRATVRKPVFRLKSAFSKSRGVQSSVRSSTISNTIPIRGGKRRKVLEDLPAFCYSPPSFLTPPFGFALCYLRAVAPPEVTTAQIYRGVVPFIIIQLIGLLLLILFPEMVTWAL